MDKRRKKRLRCRHEHYSKKWYVVPGGRWHCGNCGSFLFADPWAGHAPVSREQSETKTKG